MIHACVHLPLQVVAGGRIVGFDRRERVFGEFGEIQNVIVVDVAHFIRSGRHDDEWRRREKQILVEKRKRRPRARERSNTRNNKWRRPVVERAPKTSCYRAAWTMVPRGIYRLTAGKIRTRDSVTSAGEDERYPCPARTCVLWTSSSLRRPVNAML